MTKKKQHSLTFKQQEPANICLFFLKIEQNAQLHKIFHFFNYDFLVIICPPIYLVLILCRFCVTFFNHSLIDVHKHNSYVTSCQRKMEKQICMLQRFIFRDLLFRLFQAKALSFVWLACVLALYKSLPCCLLTAEVQNMNMSMPDIWSCDEGHIVRRGFDSCHWTATRAEWMMCRSLIFPFCAELGWCRSLICIQAKILFPPEELTLWGDLLRGLPVSRTRGCVVGVGEQELAFSIQENNFSLSALLSLSAVVLSKMAQTHSRPVNLAPVWPAATAEELF